MGDDRLRLLVADVSGKGIPIALIMATFRAALRSEMRRRRTIGDVAEQVNRILTESTRAPSLVTSVAGVLDTSSGSFCYVNGGHNPPLVLRRGGGSERLSPGGPVPGVLEAGRFIQGTARLAGGDALVLYTDGVVDHSDHEDAQFGIGRLEKVARSAMSVSAEGSLRRAIKATTAFTAREYYEDDFTLVLVKRRQAA